MIGCRNHTLGYRNRTLGYCNQILSYQKPLKLTITITIFIPDILLLIDGSNYSHHYQFSMKKKKSLKSFLYKKFTVIMVLGKFHKIVWSFWRKFGEVRLVTLRRNTENRLLILKKCYVKMTGFYGSWLYSENRLVILKKSFMK